MREVEQRIHEAKVIVFDFDGVIVLGSEELKAATWPKVLAAYGDELGSVLAQARDRGGDRHDIFRFVFNHFGEPAERIDALVSEAAAMADEHIQQGINTLGVRPQTRDFLSRIAVQYPLYINTATPTVSIEQTLKNLSLDEYFKASLGTPGSKVENLLRIAERESVSPEQVVFIGDAPTDRVAAQSFGCQFVGLADERNRWGAHQQDFPVIQVLEALGNFLQ